MRWAYLDEVMRREIAGVGLWLDTSEMTVDQVGEAILERVWGDPNALVPDSFSRAYGF